MDKLKLTRAAEKLVIHWGEMGARWGISRSVAQVHALLYVAPRPLHAAELAEALGVARSNVSTGLRELEAWGLIKVTHLLGDRRDYFATVGDIWHLFRAIVETRWRREIEPTIAAIDECVAEAERQGGDDHTRKRLEELRGCLRSLESLYEQMKGMEPADMKRAVKLGAQVRRLVRLGS